MADWSNWSGRHRIRTTRTHFLRSEADAAALAAHADRAGLKLRTAGAGHSHAPLVPVADIVADAQGLAGIQSIDHVNKRAWIGSGTRIYALGAQLGAAGLALMNQGDIDQQAIAGATGTGTHGTGVTLRNLSSAVTGMRIATASGELITANADRNAELWTASRLHLGAFGIVTALEMQLRETYRLAEDAWRCSSDEVLADLDARIARHRHFEFFWYPQTDVAFAKSIDETTEAPRYPLGDEGKRLAWSHEVLPNHRPHKHTEMEYSVPAEKGVPCFLALRDLLRNQFPDVSWPVEFRTLAADDVWMSTAYQRPTVTLSVHQTIDEDETGYYEACERIFRAHEGRPHWGKMHYLDGATLRSIHPRWDDWWQVRDSIDPNGTFLNPLLQGWRAAR